MHTHVAVTAAHSTSKHCTTHTVFGPTWKRTSEILTNRGACSSELFQRTNYMSHTLRDPRDEGDIYKGKDGAIRGIPFSAFWLRSSVVSVLISLISDTRLIESHDVNLIFQGCGSLRQLAVRPRECRLGIALSPWHAQPSPFRNPNNLEIALRDPLTSQYKMQVSSIRGDSLLNPMNTLSVELKNSSYQQMYWKYRFQHLDIFGNHD
jgi:hypothetical protein